MNKQKLVGAFAIAAVALLGLLLSTSIILANDTDRLPRTGPVPKANCGPGDHTESGLQGETTQEERFSGDSELGYNCNLELVGQEPQDEFEGAYSQDGPAYAGHCAYYGTDRVTSLQKHLGVRVIDASDTRHPRVSAYLDDTAAARAPHETVQTNERRNLLVVAENGGPDFAVYDISDCRHPVLLADIQLPGGQGHMGAFAPDGMTYWITQSFRGPGGFVYIVDLTDPSNPQELPPWQFLGDGRPHGLELNPKGFAPGVPEGTRVYSGQPGEFGNTSGDIGPDGLVILDVSDYHFRRPNPEIRIISKLFWDDQGEAEAMIPVKIKGHRYLISTDEAGGAGWAGPGVWLALGGGTMLLVLFVVWETRTPDPMLPMRFFRHRVFAAGALASLLMYAALFGALFLITYALKALGWQRLVRRWRAARRIPRSAPTAWLPSRR